MLPCQSNTRGRRGEEEWLRGRVSDFGAALRKLSAQKGALAPRAPNRTSTWGSKSGNWYTLHARSLPGAAQEVHLELGAKAPVNPQGTIARGCQLTALLITISSSLLKGDPSGTPPWPPQEVLATFSSTKVMIFLN